MKNLTKLLSYTSYVSNAQLPYLLVSVYHVEPHTIIAHPSLYQVLPERRALVYRNSDTVGL